MQMQKWTGGLLVFLVVWVFGCAPEHGQQTVSLTAGRTANIAGGKATLYFGGYPSGMMVLLNCDGTEHSIGDILSGRKAMLMGEKPAEFAEACGIKVKLAGEGESSFGNDAAEFVVEW